MLRRFRCVQIFLKLKVLQNTGRISGNKLFIPTPYRRFVLLRIAQTGVIAQGCALFFRTKLFNSISAQVSVTSHIHIGVSAPLCNKNLRTKTFKKTTAQCAKTPMITVVICITTVCVILNTVCFQNALLHRSGRRLPVKRRCSAHHLAAILQ